MPKSSRDSARRFLLVSSTIVLLGCQGVKPPAVPPGDGARSPKIIHFRYEAPSDVVEGSQITLEWATEDADSVKITGVGAVGPTGSAQVKPGRYTLTARNSNTGKQVTAEVVGTISIPSRRRPPKPLPPVEARPREKP